MTRYAVEPARLLPNDDKVQPIRFGTSSICMMRFVRRRAE